VGSRKEGVTPFISWCQCRQLLL